MQRARIHSLMPFWPVVLNWTKRLDFSARGQARVVAGTVAGIVLSLVVALGTVSYTTQFMEEDLPRTLTFAAAIVLPFVLSGPVFFYFASKLRELAMAHAELAEIASRDGLTTCLNRGAFITLVDAFLSQVNAPNPVQGALLMVDADNFKSVNDRYGHATGDAALKVIADQIKMVVRGNDLVGRVGGEEFAVFLPQADYVKAQTIAERIRAQVHATKVLANGYSIPVSVSVGGVGFVSTLPFEELFRKADAMLYEAKRLGRNRVELGTVTTIPRLQSVMG